MKRKFHLANVFVLFVFASSQGFAADGTETSDTTVATVAAVKDSSDTTTDANKTGQLLSYLTAGVLATESAQHFSSCSSHNKTQCVLGALKAGMAALSMAQASTHASTASDATTSSTATDGLGTDSSTAASTYSYSDDGTYAEASASLAKLENCVSGSCLNTKTGTITTADGKSYKVSDFSSESSMANAGIPSGAIAGLGDYQKNLESKIQKKMDTLKLGALSKTNGLDEGGSGGGANKATAEADAASAAAAAMVARNNLADKREAMDLSGLSKNYNGEPIGVSAQNIFTMITRRYKLKESQDSFHSSVTVP